MRIPFEIPSFDEVDEAAGFLYLEEEYLVFEYHILQWGLIKSEPSIVKAERGVIDDVRVQRGWFKDRLLIATHNIELLKAIPGPHASEIELRTKKKYRPQVEVFVEQVFVWKDRRGG